MEEARPWAVMLFTEGCGPHWGCCVPLLWERPWPRSFVVGPVRGQVRSYRAELTTADRARPCEQHHGLHRAFSLRHGHRFGRQAGEVGL